MEAKICKGDATNSKLPIPFLDDKERRIGQVVVLRFDGEYTIARIEIEDDAAFRRAERVSYDLYPEKEQAKK